MAESKPFFNAIDFTHHNDLSTYPLRLYHLWEERYWSATSFDFTQDALDWHSKLSALQCRALLWKSAMFLYGEHNMNITLAPFIIAIPHSSHKIFLATQIADEAKHHIFFNRFLYEVCGVGGDITDTLTVIKYHLTSSFVQLFDELEHIADQLRRHPHNKTLLAQGVTLYHILIEGHLASVGLHFIYKFGKNNGLLPNFTSGLQMILRDEARHVAFGIHTLRALLVNYPACRAAVLSLINRVLLFINEAYMPPDRDWSYFTNLGFSPQQYFSFALRLLAMRLQRFGIPPSDVLTLVKLGYPGPPDRLASNLFIFFQSGLFGSQHNPQVSEATMTALFEGIRCVASRAQSRHTNMHRRIQWIFDEIQPRYLEFYVQKEPCVGVGRIEKPDVVLYCSASDWALISAERLSLHQAVFSRRLRISGNPLTALRLMKSLPIQSN